MRDAKAELSVGLPTNAASASKPLRDAGFTKKQIWAASKKLGVVRKKGGMKDGWLWSLPSLFAGGYSRAASEDSEGSSFKNRESSEPSQLLESSDVEVL